MDLYTILDGMHETYKRDLTLDEFRLTVLTRHSEYEDLLDQLVKSNIAPEVVQQSIDTITERALAHQLAILALDVSEGRKELPQLLDFYTKFEKCEHVIETQFVTSNLETLYNETIGKPGLRWRLPTLNRMLGSLRKGDFGFIFARPETGKTTFLASEVTHFARQVTSPILWFNNEEQGAKVQTRCYQAALACDLAKLHSDRHRAYELFVERTGDQIKIIDDANITRRMVESLCERFQPSLIIFDQIDKIGGFQNDRKDLELGETYIWAREIAKKYAPVIGVCQANGEGEGRRWLTMDCVANAKTAKQAEADWILGIGKTNEVGLENYRFLHLSKNKLQGDEDSIPALRHGKCEVIIAADIARYKEIGDK